ncbi:MAG: spore germination protein [Oscillospiraceae bacterium]|nr:spore germination protein [Oscillospiraceae bacterium]
MDMNIKLDYQDEKLDASLDVKLKRIKEITQESSDLLINDVTVSGIKCSLLCCEGMLSTSTITQLVLVPLTNLKITCKNSEELLEHINKNMLLSVDRPLADNYADVIRLINSGFAVLITHGSKQALAFGVQGYNTRGIDEPSSDQNVTGAHDGFTETVRTNMSLVRRRMKSPFMKFELFIMGKKSHTDLCLCYMTDRVSKELLGRIKKSLKQIDLETILSSGYIIPFLEEKKPSIFDSVSVTERPDVLCSKLLEGRVALMIDGTPFVVVIPGLFSENFQTMDDYNCKPYYAAFIRWIKYAAFFIALLLPGVYVSIAVYYPEFLNRTLLLLLAQAEENAPLSLITESFIVLLMYEIIKEAGVRLPKAIGGAVSIVAGIIIGDAAVDSGLISTPMLTIIAISVISGFVVPDLSYQITVFRFLFLLSGGIFGLFGISLLGALMLFNVCSTEDYDYPLTSPISPFKPRSMRDIITRVGFRKMQHGNFTVEKIK